MSTDKDEVQALYAMYRAIEEKKVVFSGHGEFTSLVGTSEGVEGFWIVGFRDQDAFFVPKVVVETLAPLVFHSFTPVASEVVAPPNKTLPPMLGWDAPEIEKRLVAIAMAAQDEDTRYIRVIVKNKTGKQQTLARIAQGTSAERVSEIIRHVRKQAKEGTVMAEVLRHSGSSTLTRSFPLECA